MRSMSQLFLLLLCSILSSVAATDLVALCPAADIGKFKCVSDTQFVICNGARTIIQNMGVGVICQDGTIRAGAVSPSPASSPALSSPKLSPLSSDTRPASLSTNSPMPTLTQSPAMQTGKPFSISMPYSVTASLFGDKNPLLFPGTLTGDMVNCKTFPLKTFGKKSYDDVDQMLYCVGGKDKTDLYTFCNKSNPSAVFKVRDGTHCHRNQDKTCVVSI